MKLRRYISTIREYLNEQKILNEGYDELFIKLGFLKYYGEGTPDELKNIHKLEYMLKITPIPKTEPIAEDNRIEWGGIKLGEFVSADELPKIYKNMGHFAEDTTAKFNGNYKLKYVPVIKDVTKYSLANEYEDLGHYDRVNYYADVLRSGEELPPVIYTNNVLRDGAHRTAAHNDVGRKNILAFYSE